MIAPETTALILLAAGRSTRFGLADKLTEPLHGLPLGLHAVTALAAIPFARRIAVTGGESLDYAAQGYEVVNNPCPEEGQSLSVKLGVQAARGPGIEAVLIALADMPRITPGLIFRLFEERHGPETVVASSDGIRPRPPALFGNGRFDALESLAGDAGARDLIRSGRHVVVPASELVDVDTQVDFDALSYSSSRIT